jgi:hypothetical protein
MPNKKKGGGKLRPTKGDWAHTLTKAGISAVPFVGSPAAELFAALIVAPLAKRRDEWIESIARDLEALEERVDGLSLEDLSGNELFVTTVMQATQIVVRNHHQEKKEAARGAVLNTAIGRTPDEDTHMILLDMIDSLPPFHLRILKFFEDPEAWGRAHNIQYPDMGMMGGSPSTALEFGIPELRGRRDFYDRVVKDLLIRGLLGTEQLHVMMTGHGAMAGRTTPLGTQLIRLITSPLE